MDCGVRQGGLTSPWLFKLYINALIDELSRAGEGCSIDRKIVNNIIYTDAIALLSPTVIVLEVIIEICEVRDVPWP